MNAALLIHSVILRPIQGLMRWLNTRQSKNSSSESFTPQFPRQTPSNCLAPNWRGSTKAHPLEASIKPLRVVRILEAGQGPHAVGRMLISGRMADVCAELDRLAACEAAPS